ncbi:(S)-mandelate dehydrogenase [Pigmentiphaga humi]|uniref:(S)-mandelate dehydrogenase n=1 Tax=Pigmentiphaga humi TaxID=2478468 RepID=A0A3P4B4Y2_9BURK|nr:alpha-hydroxy acid oxidase [Pigmentiphaga humi]VCU71359.1 (S)-mandelate dehydrogenase [Pigmentiphaga humi]
MMLCLEDYRRAASRRLPRAIYGFIDGGSEEEATLRANRAAFEAVRLVPRVLVDTSERSSAVRTLGHEWAAPFGIAPMGAVGVAAFQGDLALAGAAAAANVPFVLSSASLVTMDRILKANPRTWFQAYPSADAERNRRLLGRVADAGFETLVVTVDVPVSGNREENIRRGYASPLKPNARLVADALCHPRWLCGSFLRSVAREGMPHFENMAEERAPMFSWTATRRAHRRDNLDWEDLQRMRDQWRGRLVVKGVLSPGDAALAQEAGADAVIVSNHGGRQLDGAVAPLEALPGIVAAADLPVFIDGGIRRGTDVVKALALGASHVFLGRPFLYAAAVGGKAGVQRAIELLRAEIHRNMALLGTRRIADIGAAMARAPHS